MMIFEGRDVFARHSPLRLALLFVAFTAFMALLPGTAQAADSSAASGATEDVEEVTVTGTRLQVAGFNAPTPVTVVGTETIQQRAPANIVDVLTEQPAFRIAITDSTRPTGGGGVNPQNTQATLDLRSLSPFRTLTLINGHRSVGTNWDNTVDSDIVPVGLVDRIDVVTGGASAAYGSDAVAGVVNIVLANKLQGVRATLQTGLTEYGGGHQYTLNLAGGTDLFGGRMHVIGGMDYNKSNAITDVYGTDWGKNEIGNFSPSNATRAANNWPVTQITNNVEPASSAPGGLYVVNATTAYTFDSNGNPVPFSRGTLSSNLATMIGSDSNYGHNTSDQSFLRLPESRTVLLGRATFDISDNVEGSFEVNDARSILYPYSGGEFIQGVGTGALTPTIVVAANSPYVTAATRALLPAGATTFQIGRINTELGTDGLSGTIARQDYETRRFVAGLDGKFGNNNDWKWDAFYSTGRTLLEQKRNDFSTQAMQAAVDGCNVTNTSPGFTGAAGVARLQQLTEYNTLSGKTCVPFNPFGVGRNSAAALAYIQNNSFQAEHVGLDNAEATVSGPLFAVPAGNVALAVGADWRREYLFADSDPVSAAGSGTVAQLVTNSLVEAHGTNSVKEAFTELGIPVLKDMPGAKSLDLNAAARFTDYKYSGMVHTWKVGMTWDPVDFLRVRFTRSHDIRAPNIRSLFFHGGANSTNVLNTIPAGTVGLDGTVNPGYNPATQISVPVPGNSGNPALKPEIGDTTTGGLVFTEGGFNASVDYYRIVLTDAIAALSAQQVINNCAAGDPTYCNFITFSSDPSVVGGIALLEPLLQNLNKITINGYDFEVGYRGRIGPGTASVRALVNYEPHVKLLNAFLDQTTEAANVMGQIGGMQGAGGQPKLAYNVALGYDFSKVLTQVQIRGFTSRRGNPIVYDANGTVDPTTILGPEDPGYNPANANTINKNRWPGQFTVNPQVTYLINDKVSVFLNVDNLFNVGPPPLSLSPIYDLIGRRYRAGIRANL